MDYLKTGVGVEGTGQYNFTDQGSLLLQIQLTHIAERYSNDNVASASIKGGYRLQLFFSATSHAVDVAFILMDIKNL